MKRFSVVLISLVLLISVVCFSAFASPNYNNIYGDIVYWQDYVLGSHESSWTPDSSPNNPDYPLTAYATFSQIPLAFDLSIYSGDNLLKAGQGHTIGSDYTWSNYHIIAQQGYYLGIEDILKSTSSYNRYYRFEYNITCNRIPDYWIVVVSYYNRQLDLVYQEEIDYGDQVSSATFSDVAFGIWNYDAINELGAQFVKFSIIPYTTGSQPGIILNDIKLGFSLETAYTPDEYPVNGYDGSEYYRDFPKTPEAEEEGTWADKLWQELQDKIALQGGWAYDVVYIFEYYAVPLSKIGAIFNQYLGTRWVGNILRVSFSLGAIGFLFGLAVEVASRSASNARSAKRDRDRKKRESTVKDREYERSRTSRDKEV